MARMAKRSAKNQLTQTTLDRLSDDEDEHVEEGTLEVAQDDVSARVISKPKFRLGQPSKPSPPKRKNLFAGLAPFVAPTAPPTEESAVNPWVKVRGLNVSFQKAVNGEMEKDCMADLSLLFAKYNEHLSEIRAAHPELSNVVTPTPAATTTIPTFTFPSTAPQATIAANKPQEERNLPLATEEVKPKLSFDFKPITNPAVTPTAAPTIPAFTFPSATPQTANTTNKSQEAKDEALVTEEAKPKFSFDFKMTAPVTTPAASSTFSFNPAPVETKPKEPEAVSTSIEPKLKEPESVKPAFAFDAKNFSFTPSPAEPSKAAPSFQFTKFEFPTAPKEADPDTSVELNDKKSVSGFSFAFGAKPASEISFGTPPPSLETPVSKPFSFMTSSQEKPTEASSQESAVTEDEPLEPSTITLIRTGAGEENEECVAEARVKLSLFVKDEGWSDLGVGNFKVNKTKAESSSEGPKSRTLCRSEASGLILINSAIDKSFSKVLYEEGKKLFTLTALNKEGAPATYTIRTNLPAESESLVSAIRNQLA